MRHAWLLLGLVLCVASCGPKEPTKQTRTWKEAIDVDWKPVGIGGGGGIYSPSISPHDEKLMFVACDMGGWYRSTDGGNHWRMCDGQQVRKVNFPAVFHPTDPNVLYVGTRGGLKRSRDRGKTWEHIAGAFKPDDPDMCRAIAVDPARDDVLLAGFSTYMSKPGEYLVLSVDGGDTWSVLKNWPVFDQPIRKIFFAPKSAKLKRSIFIATADGFYRSDTDGARWMAKNKGLPNTKIRDAAWAYDESLGAFVVFVTVESQWADGKFTGGICKSTDGGDTWQQVTNGLDTERAGGTLHQYRFLAMSPTNTKVVSVSSFRRAAGPDHAATVYRSADGGASWQKILIGVPDWPGSNVEPDWMTAEMSWWWGGTACGFACNPNNPDDLVFTDAGRAIRTTNGGKKWTPISSRRIGTDNWDGRGLEVTTCYQVVFDPFDRMRTYIAYTDFGLTRSLDRGKTWIYAARKVPWGNSCYELAVDPDRKGVFFGAWANAHDLIHWKMIHRGTEQTWWKGGVTKTTDHCETWTVVGKGTLPEKPATTIVLDPRSPENARTLYVGILNRGVYKSTDDGRTWTKKSDGLGSPENMSVWRLDLHADGTLLCGISLNYADGKPVGGGLYRSRDGADTWEKVRDFPYIWGVRMDPRDADVIYVACFDVPPPGYSAMGTNVPWPDAEGGGLFKTTDGGKTWKTILDQPYCWDLTFHPGNPDVLYVGTFVAGMHMSTDAGKNWTRLRGLPFVAPHRATVDPENDKVLYVTTFGGGTWQGTLP